MPKDQWDFIPTDDELPEGSDEPPAEVSAVHVRRGQARTPASDPGAADVQVGSEIEHEDIEVFQDEEPDRARGPVRPDDDEEDLEELLEEQHYSFAPESEEE